MLEGGKRTLSYSAFRVFLTKLRSFCVQCVCADGHGCCVELTVETFSSARKTSHFHTQISIQSISRTWQTRCDVSKPSCICWIYICSAPRQNIWKGEELWRSYWKVSGWTSCLSHSNGPRNQSSKASLCCEVDQWGTCIYSVVRWTLQQYLHICGIAHLLGAQATESFGTGPFVNRSGFTSLSVCRLSFHLCIDKILPSASQLLMFVSQLLR